MPLLPSLRGRELVAVFEQLGWSVARQQGSHIIMTREGSIATLAIPAHKEVAKGTLRSLIRAAEITVQEFLSVYGKG